MFKINTKKETLDILINYYATFDISELNFYFDNLINKTIPEFLESNIYDLEEIELIDLLNEYLKIAIDKIFYITTQFNYKRMPIKLSFISDSIYWDDIFVIENTIFLSYKYLIKIFQKIENQEFKLISEIYFKNDKMFDIELLKKLCKSLCHIIQFYNLDSWKEYICDKYLCNFVDKSIIKFNKINNIIKDPNTSFINDKITIYWLLSGEIYASVNIIYSDKHFSPYWDKKIIKLKYISGLYFEIPEENNIDDESLKNFDPNPFISKASQMVDCLIHN